MVEHELELSVGDSVRIGDVVLTVVDIDGGDVSFRIDPQESDLYADSLEETCVRPRK